MNEVLKTIDERFSCRDFTDTMPPQGDLQKVISAGLAAPSGLNRQAWRIILLQNKGLMAEIEAEAMLGLQKQQDASHYARIMKRGGALFYHAPCMILLPIDMEKAPHALLDCGILCQTIVLAAESLGMNTLICGLARHAFSGEKANGLKQKLSFPEGYEFGTSILLGYAAHTRQAHCKDEGKVLCIGE